MPDPTPALPPKSASEAVTRPPSPPRPAGNETECFVPAAPAAEFPTLPPDSVAVRHITVDGISIPGYEILATLGRGGMGVVYQARQTKLGRVVALKMILAGAHAGETELARFRTEAEAIARLQHPNIVQIYEIGEHGGLPYIALEYCGGGSLEKKLSGTPLPAQEAAVLVEALARAMAAAHQKGVIHRDLKPANVLFAEDGTPKITDFGLAKKLDEAGQTASGAIMGTPPYMAPEQAGGQSQRIGPPCDIYALGAILYECLTGRPPFKAATALDTMMQVVSDEPVPPSQLQTKTPRDLETICLKCLHKEPGKRYASAQELADDVRRFMNGEPIRARPVGRLERAAKWVRRNPLVTALAALVLLSVLGGAGGIFVKYLDAKEQESIAIRKAKETEDALSDRDAALEQARADAEAARQATALAEERKTLAEKREEEAQYQLATNNVLLAQAAWDNNNVAAARSHLELVPAHLRRWEWHYLNRKFQGGIFTLEGHVGEVSSVAFSPDGKRVATANFDGTVRLWDARTGQVLSVVATGHSGPVYCVAFNPDGTRLATTSRDPTARLWDARTGQLLREFKGHKDGIHCVVFSPDGTRLATASSDKTARLYDARTGQLLLEYKGHANDVRSVAFSPDGMRLATASSDGMARLWDARTGQSLLVIRKSDTDFISCVAFSPDGAWLATASVRDKVRLWDARTGQLLREFEGDTREVNFLAFSPDGTQLATMSWDRAVRLWDARTGQLIRECKGHAVDVSSVAFSPDGLRLATASSDGTARLWDVRRDWILEEGKSCDDSTKRVVFSPDGTLLATAGFDGKARLWDMRTGQIVRELKDSTVAGRIIQIFQELMDITSRVDSVAFSPDGRRLATAGSNNIVQLWDVATGQPSSVVCKGHTGRVVSVVFSPDGTRLATASEDKTARLWNAWTGRFLGECKGHTDRVCCVAFSPDGARLATASDDRKVRLWEAQTGRLLQELVGHTGPVHCVTFSPDGTRLATASWDEAARLWDARTGRPLQEYKGHTRSVSSVAFSPDGTRLATASLDQTARLWDTRTGLPLMQLAGHVDEVSWVAFSPNGAWLATASFDKLRLWDARPRPLPPGEELEYRLWATRAAPDWHDEQFHKLQGSDRFAAAFHLDRLLAYRPAQRADLLRQRTQYLTETLKQDAKNAGVRLLLARTAWHSPALGPKDAAALLPSADEKGLLARRTRGGLLLRQHKAAEAIAVLEAALKDRGDNQPPVEELLLAWAYHDTRQPDKAKALWAKAMAWLDHGQEAMRTANVVGSLPSGVLPGAAMLFAPPTHPRYNPFDWETWHELDVLRGELTRRFEAKGP